MAVLAVPMDKTFEVAVDKVENFDKKVAAECSLPVSSGWCSVTGP